MKKKCKCKIDSVSIIDRKLSEFLNVNLNVHLNNKPRDYLSFRFATKYLVGER